MEELALQQPELVGREEELNTLKRSLDNAIDGKGSTVFIAGEAGIGKTRMVNELIGYARSKDCHILQGWCFSDAIAPLMPVREAFKSIGLDHLFSYEKPPRLACVYVMNSAGILLARSERVESKLDADLFTAMLSAVGDFVKDSITMFDAEQKSALNIMGFGDYRIVIEKGTTVHMVAVITGRENEFLIYDLRKTLRDLEREFGDMLPKWGGDMTEVSSIEPAIGRLLASGKYEGVDYTAEDPKLVQENIFDNILLGLQRLSTVKPVLLFMDDLQWADPSTLVLLHYLSRNTKRDMAQIVGTYRPEDVGQTADGTPHQLETTMQNMNRENLFSKMELHRLDRTGTAALVNNVLGASGFGDTFAERMYAETEGMPFYVLEALKLLVEVGTIAKDAEGVWRLATDLDKLEIPSRVHDVVKRRLDRLAGEQREVLEWGAVMGEKFQTQLLEIVTGVPKIKLLKGLNEIEKRHRLIHYTEDRYRFDHTKIREVLYNGLGEELRKEYHRLVAEAIEGSSDVQDDSVISDLAHHYFEAGDDKARKYLVSAGDRAKERFANPEALKLYGNAIGLISDPAERVDILEKMGDVQTFTGEFDSSIGSYASAAEAADDDRVKMRLHRKKGNVIGRKGEYAESLETLASAKNLVDDKMLPEYGRICVDEGTIQYKKGELTQAMDLFFEALHIFEGADNKEDLGKALRAVGNIYLSSGEYDDALEFYEKSLEVMEDVEYQHGKAAALNNIGNVHLTTGNLDKALEYYLKCYEIIRKIGDKVGIALALNNIGVAYENMFELDKALEHHEHSLEIREKIGDKRGISFSLGNIGIVQQRRGELDKALVTHERSLAVFKETGEKWGLARSMNNIGMIHQLRGDLDKALEYFEESLDVDTEMGDRRSIALSEGRIGSLLTEKGEPDKALEHYTKSLGISREIGEKQVSVLNLCGMTQTQIDLGRPGIALEHAGEALGTSEEMASDTLIGLSRLAMATALRVNGELDKAAEEFEASKSILERVGDRSEVARLNYQYGLLWTDKGEKERARSHLEEALASFDRMGMRLYSERCRKALDGI
jgi:tetratricopeptide (TPR) repeat protein